MKHIHTLPARLCLAVVALVLCVSTAVAATYNPNYDSSNKCYKDVESGVWFKIVDNKAMVVRNRFMNPNNGKFDFHNDSYKGDIVVPEQVTINGKKYTVGGIYRLVGDNDKTNGSPIDKGYSNSAFNEFGRVNTLTSVKLPKTATAPIPYCCFHGCKKLTSVEIPEGVKEIEHHAFDQCSALKEIKLPTSLRILRHQAFQASGLTTITIPFLDIWETYTFEACESLLTAYIFGSADKTIPQHTFHDCHNLHTVAVDENITDFAEYAFGTIGELAENETFNLKHFHFNYTDPGQLPTTRNYSKDAWPKTHLDFRMVPKQVFAHVPAKTTDAQLDQWREWIRPPFINVMRDPATEVDGITGDEKTAPERWFNLQGIEFSTGENLQPGIYIKVQGTRRTKVIVR